MLPARLPEITRLLTLAWVAFLMAGHATADSWRPLPGEAHDVQYPCPTGPTHIWAMRGWDIVQWDGAHWQVRVRNAHLEPVMLWAGADDDVWVCGGRLVVHWNGQSLKKYPVPREFGTLTTETFQFRGVSGSEGSEVLFWGTAEWFPAFGGRERQICPVVLKWNGTALEWIRILPYANCCSGIPKAVISLRDGRYLMVSDPVNPTFDDPWIVVSAQDDPSWPNDLPDSWNNAQITGAWSDRPGCAWISGWLVYGPSVPTILGLMWRLDETGLRRVDLGPVLLPAWNGENFDEDSYLTGGLYALTGDNDGHGFAIGQKYILRYDGESWIPEPSSLDEASRPVGFARTNSQGRSLANVESDSGFGILERLSPEPDARRPALMVIENDLPIATSPAVVRRIVPLGYEASTLHASTLTVGNFGEAAIRVATMVGAPFAVDIEPGGRRSVEYSINLTTPGEYQVPVALGSGSAVVHLTALRSPALEELPLVLPASGVSDVHAWSAGSAWCVSSRGAGRFENNALVWEKLPLALPRRVFGFDNARAWVLAGGGRILSRSAGKWQVAATPESIEFLDIFGTSPTDVWAVGRPGAIFRWDGQTWTQTPSGTFVGLTAGWALAPDDAWAVGEFGTVLRWDGASWIVLPPLSPESLMDVHGYDSTHVWAISRQAIWRWNGESWATELTPSIDGELVSIWAASPTEVWVSTTTAALLKLDAEGWSVVPGPIAYSAISGANGTPMAISTAGIHEKRVIQDAFSVWLDQRFGAGHQASPLSDDDRDGITVLEEFAFGRDPMAADPTPLNFEPGQPIVPGMPVVATDGGEVRVRFVRRSDFLNANLLYLPEASADLVTWHSLLDAPVAQNSGFEVREVVLPDIPHTYFRLKLTHLEPR